MSQLSPAALTPSPSLPAAPGSDAVAAKVMQALLAVRATAADGRPCDEDSRLADAGFTSMEMVKVMLAVEAAFDIMIPPQDITPANFATPAAIAAMVRKLVPGA